MELNRLLILSLLTVFACQPAPPPCECGITGQDKVIIRDQEQKYVRGVFEGDPDKIESVLGDQIVAMPPNSPEVHGVEDYMKMVNELPDLLEFEYLEVEIDGGSEVAVAKGNYVMLYEIDGKEIGDEGSFVEVWKKDSTGLWKMYRNIWNSGIPLVTADSTLLKGSD